MRKLSGLCSAFLAAAVVSTGAHSALPPDPGEALREAARTGDSKRARALLEAGAAVDAPTRHNITPLSVAAGRGHLAVARLLAARGADVDARETFFGTTPLSQAIDGEHVEVVRFLLQRGAAGAGDALIDAARRGDLRTARIALATERVEPLELAAARRALDPAAPGSLRALLEQARVERPARAPHGMSPEALARYTGRYRDEQGSEVAVAVRESGLVLSTSGEPELVVVPIGRDRFESATGDTGALFEGRGGLIERLRINRQGDIRELAAVIADPQPLATAEPGSSPQVAREAARPWPQFRGSRASGNGDGQGAPASWGVATGESIRFKTAIPGIALSSPIVWGDRIFVSTAVGAAGDATFRTGLYGDATSVDDLSEHSFRLLALDARSGEVVWDREVWRGRPTVKRHTKSSLANATPATDGKRVIVLFGAVGQLAAYDFAGEQLWRRDVGVLDCNDPQAGAAEWGHASSPILHGDRVIVQADRRVDSFIAAYRLDDGSPLWRVAREEPSTWSTPNVLAAPGGDELVTNGQTIRGYDPTDGKVLWTLGPNSEVVVSTPVVGDALVYVTAGYPPIRPIYAIRPGQRGDLRLSEGQRSSAAIAWSHDRGGTYIPTPIVYRGLFYTVNNNGILTAYDAQSGKQVYQTRLGSGGSAFSASPVAADGRLYFAAETGEIHVLRAGADYALLSTQSLDEIVMATPAISDGLLVVRTLGHVVGIGDAPTAVREARSAACTCPVIMELDGWCEVHAIGYVAGLEIHTPLLFEVLDAHGHQVDLAAFPCPGCRRAIETQGFCKEHDIGFVSGLAYFSRLTFLVARARASGGSAAPCPACVEVAAAGGWCDACGGIGFAGPVGFRDRRDYEEVVRALERVQRADALGKRCEQCAAAMVMDDICPICKLEYRNGEAHPFVPRGPSGGTGAGQPRGAVRGN